MPSMSAISEPHWELRKLRNLGSFKLEWSLHDFCPGAPRPLNGNDAPPAEGAGDGGSPQMVKLIKILKLFGVLVTESIFKNFNIFEPKNPFFFQRKFRKIEHFRKIILKFKIIDFL